MESYNQHNFSSYTVLDSQPAQRNAISKKFMAGVFSWMFIALGVSAFFAILFGTNATLLSYLYQTNEQGGIGLTGLGMLITFSPLAFILVMSFGINRLSSSALTGLFVLYAAAMGMSLSSVILIYTSSSLIGCFASSAAMFGIMAVMGYTTDKDLTKMGSLLTMALIGLLVSMMINMFLHSGTMDYIVSIFGVAIFTGLTAYDVQKLKRIGAGIEFDGVALGDTRKLALMGALSLYLDFVNIFLFMLRLFGREK